MNKRVLFFTFLLLGYTVLLAQQATGDKKSALNYSRPLENKINYNNPLINQKALDYELLPVDDHTFKVKFINHPSEYLDIKIYDLIGNLIMKESIKQSRDSELEYQFEEIRSKIFVIKVKSGDENLTKKINL